MTLHELYKNLSYQERTTTCCVLLPGQSVHHISTWNLKTITKYTFHKQVINVHWNNHNLTSVFFLPTPTVKGYYCYCYYYYYCYFQFLFHQCSIPQLLQVELVSQREPAFQGQLLFL